MKTILLWILTIIIALSTMIYQRMTGPTYPKKNTISLGNKEYKLKLLRSNEIGTPCDVLLNIPDTQITGFIYFKKYKTNEEWQKIEMTRKTIKNEDCFGDCDDISVLSAILPEQPAAGKIEYHLELFKGAESVKVATNVPVVIRFKGAVPKYILYPHITFMIISLILAIRAGIEVLFKRKKALLFATITLIALGLGGLLLGPIVQKYAFGDYWTGWPFGSDWTDNKTLFAFIFWLIAVIKLQKDAKNRLWPLLALGILFSVYLIPHSMGGSELNPETGQIETGIKK